MTTLREAIVDLALDWSPALPIRFNQEFNAILAEHPEPEPNETPATVTRERDRLQEWIVVARLREEALVESGQELQVRLEAAEQALADMGEETVQWGVRYAADGHVYGQPDERVARGVNKANALRTLVRRAVRRSEWQEVEDDE